MSTNEDVRVVADHGNKFQWAKGLFYRQEGDKSVIKSSGIKAVLAISVLILTAVLLFAPNVQRQIKPRPFSSPETLKSSYQANDLISTANRATEEDAYEQSQKKSKFYSVGPSTTFTKLKVLTRSDFGKIPIGAMGKAVLMTGASNGPVKVKLVGPLTQNGVTYLSAGTILMGTGASTDERLLIQFNKLVAPSGASSNIQAVAYDYEDKIVGLRGSRVGQVATKLAAAAGLNFLGAASETLQEVDVQEGVAVKKNSLKNAALNGSAKAALDQSQEMMENVKDSQSIIEVPAETNLWVVFNDE